MGRRSLGRSAREPSGQKRSSPATRAGLPQFLGSPSHRSATRAARGGDEGDHMLTVRPTWKASVSNAMMSLEEVM